MKVAGYSAWMTLWYLVPIANVVFGIFVALRTGERFGKGIAFSLILLWLFSTVGYLIIGYGGSRYTPRRRPGAATGRR